MAPMKALKAMKGKRAMTAACVIRTIASQAGLEPKAVKSVFTELQTIAYSEVAKTERFVIPQLVILKLVNKPATEAGRRLIAGKEVHVKAKPAKKVLKAKPMKKHRIQVFREHVLPVTPSDWESEPE